MKALKFTLAGRVYHLLFNGAALFEVEDRFGGANRLIETALCSGREAFEALCEGFSILAEQGELARRALGYDPEPMVDKEEIRALVTPLELVEMRSALVRAVMLGFGREIESEEDTDLVLLELSQKKTKS